jgi:putative DNA primase/helicase
MSGRDWRAFDAELRARVPELAVELLGKPTFRAGQEWRWGRKGSLSVVVGGARAGMWFDHEEGRGGWFSDLVGRDLGMAREDATDWIADRIGMAALPRPARQRSTPGATPANDPGEPPTAPATAPPESNPDDDAAARAKPGGRGCRARCPDLDQRPSRPGRPSLSRRQAGSAARPAHGRGPPARRAAAGHRRPDPQCRDHRAGRGQALPGRRGEEGAFRGGGAEPGPLGEPTGPVLICEGWATGASLHIATGHTVIAAMDAGNLMPVTEALRARFPDADLVLVADNDLKPDRDSNPGVEAARKVALAVDGRLAVPDSPGDANDLFCAEGPERRRGAGGRCGPDPAATADLSGAGPHARRSPRQPRRGDRRLHGRDPGLLGRGRGGAGGGDKP